VSIGDVTVGAWTKIEEREREREGGHAMRAIAILNGRQVNVQWERLPYDRIDETRMDLQVEASVGLREAVATGDKARIGQALIKAVAIGAIRILEITAIEMRLVGKWNREEKRYTIAMRNGEKYFSKDGNIWDDSTGLPAEAEEFQEATIILVGGPSDRA